jgi:hypothetical protein
MIFLFLHTQAPSVSFSLVSCFPRNVVFLEVKFWDQTVIIGDDEPVIAQPDPETAVMRVFMPLENSSSITSFSGGRLATIRHVPLRRISNLSRGERK